VSGDGRADVQRAAELCAALARDPRVHELGISITVIAEQRCVWLEGVVATAGRREQISRVLRELLPGFEIRNDVSVGSMAPPEWEMLD
jgi:hypothetical protein